MPAWIIITEYFQYFLLGSKDEKFVIKYSRNPTDYLNVPVLGSVYIFVGYILPLNLPINAGTFFFWSIMNVMIDFVFGITHYWTHSIPWLRKLHLRHHEYRREDLNTMANYFAEFTDAFIMNLTNIVLAFLTVLFRQNPVVIKELFTNGVHTHHKYPTHQLTHYYWFEFELIDMMLGRNREANFHNAHHHHTDKFFSFVGLVSDEVFINFTKGLEKYLPRSLFQ
jgi:sterol desaturase/sphingolipid hydroxylase (fatty acid hydroxylase superfamily)